MVPAPWRGAHEIESAPKSSAVRSNLPRSNRSASFPPGLISTFVPGATPVIDAMKRLAHGMRAMAIAASGSSWNGKAAKRAGNSRIVSARQLDCSFLIEGSRLQSPTVCILTTN